MNNTIFDDVFRTMIEKMPYLAVPLINEVFHTSYPENVPIVQLRNEHQQENGEIITDSCLKIAGKLYHIESRGTGLRGSSVRAPRSVEKLWNRRPCSGLIAGLPHITRATTLNCEAICAHGRASRVGRRIGKGDRYVEVR